MYEERKFEICQQGRFLSCYTLCVSASRNIHFHKQHHMQTQLVCALNKFLCGKQRQEQLSPHIQLLGWGIRCFAFIFFQTTPLGALQNQPKALATHLDTYQREKIL